MGEEMGRVSGSYNMDGETILCTVEVVQASGLYGDDFTAFTFMLDGEQGLIYQGVPIASIEAGSSFSRYNYDSLKAKDLPFYSFLLSSHPLYLQTCYAWAQGSSNPLVIASSPDEYGRDWDGLEMVDGSDVIITAEQQENILAQLQEIAAGYKRGEYPAGPEHPDFGYEYAPYASPWPLDVPMEINVQPHAIYYCTKTEVRWFNVEVYLMLNDEWILCASIGPYPNPVSNWLNADYWTVDLEYYFMNSSGDILDYSETDWYKNQS